MYHSITFRTKSGTSYNTWSDWHLIPASRPTIEHPEKLTNYVSVPGRQGTLNITNYLYAEPVYKDRSGSFEFYAMEGYGRYETIKTAMLRALHGQEMEMILEDDPGYYYVGRIQVGRWDNEAARPNVSISYTIKPYKYNLKTNAPILVGDF